jgi:dienelactone hydrolase
MTASDVAERIRTRSIMCGEMPAFLAEPQRAAQGAVIVIHERYGLTRHICELAERCAADGYVAVAPDLYFRHPDQAALHRGDAGCDVSDPDALAALEQAAEALAPGPDRAEIVQRFAADVAPDYDFGRNVRYE